MPGPQTSPPTGAVAAQPPIPLGYLVAGHGVRGLARVRLFNPVSTVLGTVESVSLVPRQGATRSFRVVQSRPHKNEVLLGLEGIDSLDLLEPWIGSRVEVEVSCLPAPGSGELYHFESIGLCVETADGTKVGTVSDVLSMPGHDVWVVQRTTPTEGESEASPSAREILIPLVGSIVREIDLSTRRAVIDPPEGLIDGEPL